MSWGYVQWIALIVAMVTGAALVRQVNWSLVGNRALNWLAAIGVFLLCDAVGVQQLAADCLQRVSWNVTQGK